LGQRALKSDARGAGQPLTVQTLYAEDGIGSTVLGQYANQRSANSAASAGQSDSTEIIYLPTASGPMPIAAEINGRLYAIHTDHLNTPRGLTNQQGQVAWQWPISGFGEVRPTTGDIGYGQRPQLCAGREFDLRDPYLCILEKLSRLAENNQDNRCIRFDLGNSALHDADGIGFIEASGTASNEGEGHRSESVIIDDLHGRSGGILDGEC
jgi:hypothetical protein